MAQNSQVFQKGEQNNWGKKYHPILELTKLLELQRAVHLIKRNHIINATYNIHYTLSLRLEIHTLVLINVLL